jgi:hypothetical protein
MPIESAGPETGLPSIEGNVFMEILDDEVMECESSERGGQRAL